MNRTLNELHLGECATVRSLSPDGNRNIAKRLMDIGLTGGARIEYLFAAPSGEPRAYLIRGAVIALRQEDAQLIQMSRETEGFA